MNFSVVLTQQQEKVYASGTQKTSIGTAETGVAGVEWQEKCHNSIVNGFPVNVRFWCEI